ncbi:MAG TPA: hypothetical protein VF239_12920, partial [Vicinamibacterales bacterium]
EWSGSDSYPDLPLISPGAREHPVESPHSTRASRSWAPFAVVGVALAAFVSGGFLYATYPAWSDTSDQARASTPRDQTAQRERVRAEESKPAAATQIAETAPATPDAPAPSATTTAPERPRPAAPERATAASDPPTTVATADTAAPAPADDADSPSLTGEWLMNTRVVASNLQRYEGLRLDYQLRLRQVGNNITGTGYKLRENDRVVVTKTPITLQGDVDGDRVVLMFREGGTRRASAGKLVLHRESNDVLRGRFSSDAAQSSGIVAAHR